MNRHAIRLGVLCVVLMAGTLATDSANAFQRKKLKIGNGALLRRIFGKDESKEKTPKKPSSKKHTEDDIRGKLDQAKRELDQKIRRLQKRVAEKFSVDQEELKKNRFDSANRPVPTPYGQVRRPQSQQQRGVQPPGSRNYFSQQGRSGSPQLADQRRQRYEESIAFKSSKRQSRDQTRSVLDSQNPLRSMTSGDRRAGEFSSPLFGVRVVPSRSDSRLGNSGTGKGLLIQSVAPGSVAQKIGLQRGDRILKVAGMEISSIQEIESLMKILTPSDRFEIDAISGGKKVTKTVNGNFYNLSKKQSSGQPWPPSASRSSGTGSSDLKPYPTPAAKQPKGSTNLLQGYRPNRLNQSQSQLQQLQKELQQKNQRIQQLELQLKSMKNTNRSTPKSLSTSGSEDDSMELELELSAPGGI